MLLVRWFTGGIILALPLTAQAATNAPPTLNVLGPETNVCSAVYGVAQGGIGFGNVVNGTSYSYQASGCASYTTGGYADPDGLRSTNICSTIDLPAQLTDGGDLPFVCNGLTNWSLVGKIGNFCLQLGKAGNFIAPSSGYLRLYCNDQSGLFWDNGGSWNACVSFPQVLSFGGAPGGPYIPASDILKVTNSGTVSLSWASKSSQNWVSLSPTNGILPAGTSATVTVSINSNANGLSAGNYAATITFTNISSNSGTTNRIANLTIVPAAAAPSGLAATAVSASQINLSWTDNSSNEDGFKIERSNNGTNFTQIAQVLPNVIKYQNKTLFPNATYYYRVQAFNLGGASPYSTTTNASTPGQCPTGVTRWSNTVQAVAMPTNVVSISAGLGHDTLLMRDGTVMSWGDNAYGQSTPPAGLTGVVAIAAGGYHNLALKSDGSVVGWGHDGVGQSSPPSDLTGVVAIGAGYLHSLALKSDGTVVAWGGNSFGQINVPEGLIGVIAVAGGQYHSLALKCDGTVVAWGDNSSGQTNVPAGLTSIVAISAGNLHSLALRADGTVVGWGWNDAGQATPPVGLSNVVAIACGTFHSAAMKSDGSIVMWGGNYSNQLNPPPGLNPVIAIAARDDHTLTLHCSPLPPVSLTASPVATNQIQIVWVDSSSDEGGFQIERAPDNGGVPGAWAQIATVSSNVTSYTDTGLPISVKFWYRVRAYNAAAQSYYSNVSSATIPDAPTPPSGLIVTTASATEIDLSWSDNSNDEEGFRIYRSTDGINFVQIAQVLPNTTSYRNTGLWPGITYYYRVSSYKAGSNAGSSVAVAATAPLCPTSIVGWGANGSGQTTVPAGLTNIVAVKAGTYHSLALKGDGTVVGWGANDSGQTTTPAGLTGVVAVASGWDFSLALKFDGTIVGWGQGLYGGLDLPSGLTNVVAIEAANSHALALKSDGTVICWGDNSYSVSTPPTGLTAVVAISAGETHSLALKSDGTVVGWGRNNFGQATPPLGLSNVVAISGGFQHSLVLKADGTVFAWGRNDDGQTNSPAGLTGVVTISAGAYHNLALKSDGTLVAWGDNYNCQTCVPTGLMAVVAISAGYLHNLAMTCAPYTPSNLVATAVATNQIDLSWVNLAGNEDGFLVERSGNGTNFTQIGSAAANVTSYSDIGLLPNTRYWYRVQSFNAAGNSIYSSQTNAATPPLPAAAPSNLVATAVSATEIDLSWTDNAVSEDGFTIERSSDGINFSQIAQLLVNGTAYRDTRVWPGTTYYYRVRAYNSAGNSASPTASAAAAALCLTSILGWGDNGYGQSSSPAGASNIVAIATGAYQSLALRNDHTVLGWGGNWVGQATPPAGLTGVVAIAAGRQHSIALKADGTVVCWGWNIAGQASPPAGLSNVVSIAAGYYHSLALKSDGTVVGWGDNGCGEITPPAGLSGVIVVSAGWCHSLALKSDGTVVSWGASAEGERPPAGLAGVVAIASGDFFNLALKSDGTVVGWGDNSIGQATPPAGLTGVVAIAAIDNHCLALKSDGTVVAWGDNSGGQFTPPAGLSAVTGIGAGLTWGLAISCAPSAPSALTTTAVSPTQINLSWTDNSNSENGFNIERAPDSGGSPGIWSQIATVGVNVTSYPDAGLPPQTKYWYRVRAYNASGGSPYSNQSTATSGAGYNSWTSPSNGKWETAGNWLLGLAPAINQWGILITNANTKTITIDATTSGSFPATVAISNLTISGPAGATNTLSLSNTGTATPLRMASLLTLASGGAITVSNSALQVDWATRGTNRVDGAITVLNGLFTATNTTTWIGSTNGATGRVELRGGSMTCSNLTIGAATNAIGQVGMLNSQLVVTNLTLTLGRFGRGELTASNSVVRARTLSIANGDGSSGLLTLVNSTNTVSTLLIVANGTGSTGNLWIVDGSVLSNSGGSASIGFIGDATLNVSNSSIYARGLSVADNTGRGTATFIGSSIISDGSFIIGNGSATTGTVTIVGGQLNAFTNVFMVGQAGNGRLTASNCTMQGGTTYIGTFADGTLTLLDANMTAGLATYIGLSSSGTVWVSGNSAFAMARETYLGYGGIGRLVLSNGTMSASNLLVSVVAPDRGTLTVDGGAASVSTALIIGDCASNGIGQVTLTSGVLAVTNATHTAVLDVRGGTLTMLGGTLLADRLVMTNACGRFIRNGGTMTITTFYLDPSLSAVGDGIPNGWKQQYGLDPFDPTVANADSDGDGFGNLKEYLAGTNPTNSSTALRITAIIPVGADVRVYFTSIGGKYYSLQRCDFMGGAWTDIVINIPGDDGIQWVKDIGGAARAGGFYRIELDQLSSPPPADSDGDGIVDCWAQQYFGHPTGQTNDLSCATCDADGTGQNNLFKYLAGLDPTSSASIFLLTIQGVPNQPMQRSLVFSPLSPGRTFTPQFSTNLTLGDWSPLTGYDGPVTNGSQVTITDTNAIESSKFYRIKITYP